MTPPSPPQKKQTEDSHVLLMDSSRKNTRPAVKLHVFQNKISTCRFRLNHEAASGLPVKEQRRFATPRLNFLFLSGKFKRFMVLLPV